MTNVPPEIVRSAAQRLVSLDALLPAKVEARLHQPDGGLEQPSTYEPVSIAIAALLISAASLAWTIYKDTRKSGAPPAQEVIERRVRLETEIPSTITGEQSDLVIKTVVEEVIHHQP
jgi:hypothetical protein